MKNKPNVFFSFDFLFFFHILYKGKHLGIQQSLTWQTEEQRNTGRTGSLKERKKTNEGKRAGSDTHYTLKVCRHEYRIMNTEMMNKASFSQRTHHNQPGLSLFGFFFTKMRLLNCKLIILYSNQSPFIVQNTRSECGSLV